MKKHLAIILALIIALVCGFATFAFADADPYVSIVNPSGDTTVYAPNLLVSVKITKAETITVEVSKESTVTTTSAAVDGTVETKTSKVYTPVAQKETFTSTNSLSYYTKKFEEITPGTYRILVKTVDANGEALYTTSKLVKVAAKEVASTTFSSSSGTFTFLQNLLKTIFGD